MRNEKKYPKFTLIIEQKEDGLETQMDYCGFDPMHIIGFLELQKNEILMDLREQEELHRKKSSAMSLSKNNQA